MWPWFDAVALAAAAVPHGSACSSHSCLPLCGVPLLGNCAENAKHRRTFEPRPRLDPQPRTPCLSLNHLHRRFGSKPSAEAAGAGHAVLLGYSDTVDSVDLEPFCRYCAGAGFRQAVPYAHRTGSGRWSRKGWSYCCWLKALEEKLPMQEHDSVLKTPSVWILSEKLLS